MSSRRTHQLTSLAILLAACHLGAKDQPKKNLVEPPVVEAAYDGKPVPAPCGAVILFDGKGISQWKGRVKKDDPTKDDSVKWRLAPEGYLEVVKGSGSIGLRERPLRLGISTSSGQRLRSEGKEQRAREQRGLYRRFPEVQVLDSYENVTYFDGQAGALYKKNEPIVNASRPRENGNATTSLCKGWPKMPKLHHGFPQWAFDPGRL